MLTEPSSPLFRHLLRHTDDWDTARHPITSETLPGATRRPHICFVSPEAWPVFSGDPAIKLIGGAEVQQCILARLLASAGYRVSMICLDYGQPPRVVMDGVTIYRSYRPNAGIPGLRFFHPRLTGMWRAMREVDADIYYQRTASMLTAVVAAFCRWHGKHSIYAGASDSDFSPGQQLVNFQRDRWLFERGLAAVDAVVVQNQTQQRDCLENYGRNATVIQNCYELPADAQPGADDYVLWVATMRPGKRPDLFLEMARRLPHRRFVMVGGAAGSNPADTSFFTSIRSAAGALSNVDFVGFRPLAEVEPLFDRARIVVNTSIVEGMPNIFLQAWARGIPTVAYIDVGARHAGMPVYRVVDDTTAAVREIERLFTDESYRTQASLRCASYFAATHAKTAVLASYTRLLSELVSGEHRGHP